MPFGCSQNEFNNFLDRLNFAKTEFLAVITEISNYFSRSKVQMSQNCLSKLALPNPGQFMIGDLRRDGILALCCRERDHGSHVRCGLSMQLLI